MKLAAILILFMLSGCAYIGYNAETKQLTYWRIGNQQIADLSVTKGDTDVYLGDQSAKNDEIITLLNQILMRLP